eukprot:7012510-Pyramimonas_sp.AAC.1
MVRDEVEDRGKNIAADYLKYKERVCRQVYSQRMSAEQINRRLEEAEALWPECKTEGGPLCRPAFQGRTLGPGATEAEAADDAAAWGRAYLDED